MDPETEALAWVETNRGERTPVKGSCFFGRTRANTIVVPDERVSRRHAMVNAQAGSEYWLVDLGSSNGTYLNGRRVSQPCVLSDGDRIEIGGFPFVFRQRSRLDSQATEGGNDQTIQDIRTRNCWLLVADIEASTQFSQNAAGEEGLRVTGRWLASCKELVEANGGTINKFLGDGFFAYWIDDDRAVDHVTGALKGLRELQDADPLRFRMVVHQGPVFVGGAASMGEESLLGNEVNFVFRMEKLAAQLGLRRMLSEPASRRLEAGVEVVSEGRQPLAGFNGEFDFFSF